YRGTGSFRGWLLRIAVNEARQFWRRGRRGSRSHPADPLFDDWAASHDEGVPDQVSRREFEQALSRALESFPERLKVPLVLHYYEQMPLGAIAEVLGLPRSTVQSRCEQAVARLRKDFDKRRLHALLPVLGQVFQTFPAATRSGLLTPALAA